MENEKIERAYRANGCRVHLTMPLNPAGFREFEVRFGDSARSKKMPRPPSTKIIQVNVASGATRVVRRIVPMNQPTMAPTAPDWAASKGAAPGGRVETEKHCGKYTWCYAILFCCSCTPCFICRQCRCDERLVYIDPNGNRYQGPDCTGWRSVGSDGYTDRPALIEVLRHL